MQKASTAQEDTQARDHFEVVRVAESRGQCWASGLLITECKASDICDCFDYPDYALPEEEIRAYLDVLAWTGILTDPTDIRSAEYMVFESPMTVRSTMTLGQIRYGA